MCLSDGQATVERGFSINANLIVENLQEESITAQRIFYDNISFTGGVLKIPLTKELQTSVRGSHQRYLASLNAKKEDSTKEEQKKKLREDTEDLAKKKKQCENEFESLTTTAGELAEKSESELSLLLVVQSNALRQRAREKAEELKLIDDE